MGLSRENGSHALQRSSRGRGGAQQDPMQEDGQHGRDHEADVEQQSQEIKDVAAGLGGECRHADRQCAGAGDAEHRDQQDHDAVERHSLALRNGEHDGDEQHEGGERAEQTDLMAAHHDHHEDLLNGAAGDHGQRKGRHESDTIAHGRAPDREAAHTTIMMGFSIRRLNAPRSSAPSAPSTARWSVESVTVIRVAASTLPLRTTARSSPVPTARMVAWGGLMTAAKSLMPYMPRLDTAVEPP